MEINQLDWNSDWLTLSQKGPQRRAVSLLSGVSVEHAISYGPIKIRPIDGHIDSDLLKKGAAYNPQNAVMELCYIDIDQEHTSSMYMEPMDLFFRALQSIQLLVNNWVGSSVVYHINFDTNEQYGIGGSRRFELSDMLDYEPAASLNRQTAPSKELFIKVFEAQSGHFDSISGIPISPLSHALERFSRACGETRRESVVDFVVVLEQTLGYKLGSEIGHRIATRGALLLSDTPSSRLSHYNILKYLYDARSKLVHEGTYGFSLKSKYRESILNLGYSLENWNKGPWNKAYCIADIAREIARDVLLKFVENRNLLDQEKLQDIELGIVSPKPPYE